MEKDAVPFGIITGVITPIIGFGLCILLNYILVAANVIDKEGEAFQLSSRLILMISVCMNLIPFQWAKGQRFDNMMRGIIFPTVILVIYWVSQYSAF